MMKQSPVYIAVLIILCATSGCMTSSMLSDKISDMQSSAHEFAPVAETHGHYLGAKHIGHLEYHEYRFPEALIGHEDRELVVLIPLDEFRRGMATNPDAKLEETAPKYMSGQLAVLYFDPPSFRAPYPGRDQAQRWPSGTSPNLEQDVGVVVLWVAHASKDTIKIAQAAPGVEKSNTSFNSFFVEPKLRYVARRKTSVCLMHFGYLITIPIDIITFPLQALIGYAFLYGL